MSDQAAVWDAFRDQVSRGLARHPEATLAHLAAEFSPASRTEARAVLAFAAVASTAYDPPEPWPEPDGPGPSCNWCGRTDPGGGLTDTYPAPARRDPATVADPMTLGISYARPGPPEVRTMAGDVHCVDEDRCQQEREAALPVWRHHQFGDRRRGQEPAWLTRLRDDAEVTLTGCEVVSTEVGGWLRLQLEVEAGVLALAADQQDAAEQEQAPYYPVHYDPQLGHWMHTMRNQDNRSWTLGYKLAAMPQASSAPDALAADAVAGQKEKPKRRRRGRAARYRR